MKRAVVVLAVLLVLAAGGAVVRAAQYQGAAKPGVRVVGVDVGGKSRSQIETARPTERSTTSTELLPRAAMNRQLDCGSNAKWSMRPLTSGRGMVRRRWSDMCVL